MAALAPGVVIAGKYVLEKPLAQGGMGAVWIALDTRLEVRVAVKFIAPSLSRSAEMVVRFEREAKSAAQLRSPHVVQVFEYGVDHGMPYMVMELLEGEDLGERLRRQGRLSLSEAAVIMEQACKALRKAHEAGIVHRDIKPSNIFLARHDEDEVVKLLDFGIAKSVDSSVGDDGTHTGALLGSPKYVSPEQVRSSRGVDHRSDLWSLGLVMFRIVTGEMAFVGDSDADTMVKLCSAPIPVPSSVAGDLPPDVDAWFKRALVREPEGRFQSAREMASTFAKLLGRAPEPSVRWAESPPAAATLMPETHVREANAPTSSVSRPKRTGSVEGLEAGASVPSFARAPGEGMAVAPLTITGPSDATLASLAASAPAPTRGRKGLAWGVGAAVVLGVIEMVVALRPGSTQSTQPTVAASAAAAATANALRAKVSVEASAAVAPRPPVPAAPVASVTTTASGSAAPLGARRKAQPPRTAVPSAPRGKQKRTTSVDSLIGQQ
jgi:eukaryotic-like serine/threonine-protein kinase